MGKERGNRDIEIGISRHAPKPPDHILSGTAGYDVSSEPIDLDAAESGVQQFATELVARLERAPRGAVMALEPSNVERAEQTRQLVRDKVRMLLSQRDDIVMVDIGEDGTPVINRIKSEPDKKFLITDIRDTALLGFERDEVSARTMNKWKGIFQGNEHLVGKLWAAHSSEISSLEGEVQRNGIVAYPSLVPAEFGSTPESAAIRQIRWMRGMKKIGEGHLPGRPLFLEGVSHNIRADFAILALLGEDISVSSIGRVLGGRFREPFERSSVIFTNDGHVGISFRQFSRTYTEDEFIFLLKTLYEKSKKRKEEWQQYVI